MAVQRALIIEEDVESRRILRETLHSAGWVVEEAAGGVEALGIISQARAYGEGFNCILSDVFLPDVDGNLFLATLRRQYPRLPLVVTSAFPDGLEQKFLSELDAVYMGVKPFDTEALMEALGTSEFTESTLRGEAASPGGDPGPAACAYFFVKLETLDDANKLLSELRELNGVISVNAVRGENINLIMRVGGGSVDEIAKLLETVQALPGVANARHELVASPPLGIDLQEFVEHYRVVASEAHADYVAGVSTNAYLMIDIDRYQLERIYLAILLTEGVIRCRVVSGLSKLMVLAAGAVSPNVVRHLLGKLAQLDGIRRVKEVTVVNMSE